MGIPVVVRQYLYIESVPQTHSDIVCSIAVTSYVLHNAIHMTVYIVWFRAIIQYVHCVIWFMYPWSHGQVTIVVADSLAFIWCQGICNHHEGVHIHQEYHNIMLWACLYSDIAHIIITTVYYIALFPTLGIILCMCPANEWWRYTITPSLIGWAHT